MRDRGRGWGRATPSPLPSTPSPAPRRASQPAMSPVTATVTHTRLGAGAAATSPGGGGPAGPVRSPTLVPAARSVAPVMNGTETGIRSRDAIHQATTFILREAASPPRELLSSSPVLGTQWTEEMNHRTKMLAKSAKAWTQAHDDVSRAREHNEADDEKERKAFCDALKDGYVLCQ